MALVSVSEQDQMLFRKAVSHAHFVTLPSLSELERAFEESQVGTAVVTTESFRERGSATLSVLTSSRPEVSVIAYLDAGADLPHQAHAASRAGANAIIVRGVEDHPDRICERFLAAGRQSVADSVQAITPRTPPVLAAPNVERVLESIRDIQRVKALAQALGTTKGTLRSALRDAQLWTPKLLLAYMRMLLSTRLLTDRAAYSIEGIGLDVGYASGSAYHNACRALLGATPATVREQGGLRYALRLVRQRLDAWRRATS